MQEHITDNTMTLISLVMLTGGIFIGVIARSLYAAGCSLMPDEREQRIMIGLALLIIAALTIDPRDDIYISAADRALIDAATLAEQKITLNLDDCGPRTDGLTDQIVMTIEAQADQAPRITGCVRIAQRQYITAKEQ
jgi:hypothetical protein